MQVKAPRRLEDPVKLDEAHGHHDQVGGEVVFAQGADKEVQELPEFSVAL
jgi:hypothetical protein